MKNIITSLNKGSSTVIAAIAVSLIFGCTSLVVDAGILYLEKARLSSSVDAAALAGVQELASNPAYCENKIMEYLNANSGTVDSVTVTVDEAARTVNITAAKNCSMFFARMFGITTQPVSFSAGAIIQNISAVSGAKPFAVGKQDFQYGQLYTLKEGASGAYEGNFHCLSLGGSGSSVYSYNLINGYDGTVNAGDLIDTEPGNMAQPTRKGIETLIGGCTHTPQCTHNYYNRKCQRIMLVPVVETTEVSGRSCVRVEGFATFFLEDVVNSGGHTQVKGRFITYNAEGETSSEAGDYGTYGIKLFR